MKLRQSLGWLWRNGGAGALLGVTVTMSVFAVRYHEEGLILEARSEGFSDGQSCHYLAEDLAGGETWGTVSFKKFRSVLRDEVRQGVHEALNPRRQTNDITIVAEEKHRREVFGELPASPGAIVLLGGAELRFGEWAEMFYALGAPVPVLNRSIWESRLPDFWRSLPEIEPHHPSLTIVFVDHESARLPTATAELSKLLIQLKVFSEKVAVIIPAVADDACECRLAEPGAALFRVAIEHADRVYLADDKNWREGAIPTWSPQSMRELAGEIMLLALRDRPGLGPIHDGPPIEPTEPSIEPLATPLEPAESLREPAGSLREPAGSLIGPAGQQPFDAMPAPSAVPDEETGELDLFTWQRRLVLPAAYTEESRDADAARR